MRFRGIAAVLSLVLAASGAAVVPATASAAPPAQVRQQADLNGTWRFIRSDVGGAQARNFNDASWSAVTVPHTWNAQDGQDGGSNYYRGEPR